MKKSTQLKVLATLTEVIAIVIVLICVFISIKPHIDIAKGYIGQQEVTIVKFFHYLTVHDKEGNERHYRDVTGYSFIEDELILNIEESEDEGRTEKISRVIEIFKIEGKTAIAILDFSKLTILYPNGGKTYYYNVKSIVKDSFNSLRVLYYNGNQEWIE